MDFILVEGESKGNVSSASYLVQNFRSPLTEIHIKPPSFLHSSMNTHLVHRIPPMTRASSVVIAQIFPVDNGLFLATIHNRSHCRVPGRILFRAYFCLPVFVPTFARITSHSKKKKKTLRDGQERNIYAIKMLVIHMCF